MRGRVALGLCVAALCAPASASATVYTVNTTGDHNDQSCSPADCTIREALAAAVNAVDEVHVPPGTYGLVASLGELVLDRDTLVGTNARATIIRAGTARRVVRVSGEAPSEISGVTLTGGAPVTGATVATGGGVLIEVGASLTLLDSTVSGNTAPVAGGIMASGNLTIARSTISGNVASSGVAGGIAVASGATATLTNTTVSGNRAEARSGRGGGIYTQGTLNLDSVTVAGNRTIAGGGGGIGQAAPGQSPTGATIRDTIVAGNVGGDCAGDATVIAAWQGNHDLDQDGSCGFTGTGDKSSANPLLGPLANNGGPTNTHAIAPPSPAINAGDPANCSIRDQRGVTRGLRACDIGAFEYVAPTTPGGGGLPDPVFHRSVNALPQSGVVKIKLPGRRRFRVLAEGEQIPLGTIVDVRRGRVTIVAAAGGDQQAEFYAGIFKLSQTKGSRPITVLRLVEKLSCKKKGSKASTAAKKKRKRRLWGDGKGRFRTKGRHSAATVVGTRWLVEDRCTSTLTRVRRGRVKVRDFVKHKTVIVKAGKRYIARARR